MQDTNGDGKVSWNEFLTATAERQLIDYQNNVSSSDFYLAELIATDG